MATNYNVKGVEQTRGELAKLLLKLVIFVISLALIGCFILIGLGKLEIGEAITLILAISTIFSGLLGVAITYYFTSK